MKVSIWQQFSSNHSNSFTVVGKFVSEVEAVKAAVKWNEILEDIYLQGINYFEKEPLQAEIDLGRECGFEWTEHLDWIWIHHFQHIHQFGRYVSVSSIHSETHQRAKHISLVMAALGDETYVHEDEGVFSLLVNFQFRVPDEDKATDLVNILENHLSEMRAGKGYSIKSPWQTFVKSPYLPNPERPYDNPDYGYIHRKGQLFWFSHLTFIEIGVGLPAMIAYLQSEGCTDIEYSIEECEYDTLYEEGDE